jgi:hypothetical protein
VHDGAPRAAQRLDGALDQLVARGRHDLDGHAGRNAPFVDELAHEVELDLRRRGKADLDLLEAGLHQQLEHAQLALGVHGFHQRLVAVAQIGRQPDRRAGQDGVGPGAVPEADGREGAVLGAGLLEHGVILVGVVRHQQHECKRPAAGAYGPFEVFEEEMNASSPPVVAVEPVAHARHEPKHRLEGRRRRRIS